jgi:hypothetical protein
MKKTYITPLMEVENLEAEQIMAASRFDVSQSSQSITLTEEEYEGEFSAKEFDWD